MHDSCLLTTLHVFNCVSYPKQLLNSFSYRLLSVKRELDDFARQMQQPSKLLYIFGLWKPNICVQNIILMFYTSQCAACAYCSTTSPKLHISGSFQKQYLIEPFQMPLMWINHKIGCFVTIRALKTFTESDFVVASLGLTHMGEVGQQSDSIRQIMLPCWAQDARFIWATQNIREHAQLPGCRG